MAINTDAVGTELEPVHYQWTPRDVILYNIGIGATELHYVWEAQLKVLPTFAVVPPFNMLAASIGPMGANPTRILHGEQKIILKKAPLPAQAKAVTHGKITELYDKGKGALYRVHTTTRVEDSGEELFDNVFSIFVRGEGGFGGDKGPEAGNNPPDREPDAVVEYETLPVQNLIYRLSGDYNPLHVDPNFAKLAGFERPILHGLCTYGFVGRAVIEGMLGGDESKLAEYEARFRNVVFPGQKIITKMWKDGDNRCVIQAETDDGRVCIANAAASWTS